MKASVREADDGQVGLLSQGCHKNRQRRRTSSSFFLQCPTAAAQAPVLAAPKRQKSLFSLSNSLMSAFGACAKHSEMTARKARNRRLLTEGETEAFATATLVRGNLKFMSRVNAPRQLESISLRMVLVGNGQQGMRNSSLSQELLVQEEQAL